MIFSSTAWFLLAGTLLAIGLALLLRASLLFIVDIAAGLARRVRSLLSPNGASYARLFAALRDEHTQDTLDMEKPPSALTTALRSAGSFPLALLGGVLLAFLAHDWLISPVLLAISIVLTVILYTRARRARWSKLTDEAETLTTQFASRYPIRSSVRLALEDSIPHLPEGTVRSAVEASVRRLRTGMPESEAYRPLEAIPHPIPRRLVRVLEKATQVESTVFADLLARLHADSRDQRDLQNRMRTELTLVAGTVSILQGVLAVSLIAVGIMPAWRAYYLADPAQRLLYALMAAVGIAGSLYVEGEYQLMEEAL